MQLHELQPNNLSSKKRVGRGGKRGTYSGRGQNGQKCRSGANFQPLIRDWIKKYHKLRGYNNYNIVAKQNIVINLEFLDKKFDEGETVSPEILYTKKLIRKVNGKLQTVKILGDGALTKKLRIYW